MSLQRIIIDTDLDAAGFKSQCPLAVGGVDALQSLETYFSSLGSGMQMASVAVKVAAVQASGTIVQASTGAADGQTGTICGVTFTARTSGATGNEWNRNNTPSVSAAALAAAINASEDLTGIVTAEASSGTVTLTAVVPGLIGNGLVMASVNWANTTVTSFANGTDGTAYTISRV